jgi:hypothetical protein
MNYLKSLALAAFLPVLAQAAPGSYAQVTFAFKVTRTVDLPDKVLRSGNISESTTVQAVRIGNLEVLAEAQRRGMIAPGSLTGWRIFAVSDADGFVGFYAKNGVAVVNLANIVDLDREEGGQTDKYAGVRNLATGALRSGTNTWRTAALIGLEIGGVTYKSTTIASAAEKLRDFGPLGVAWVSGEWKANVAGYGEDFSVFEGSVTAKGATANALMDTVFPGAVGNDDED